MCERVCVCCVSSSCHRHSTPTRVHGMVCVSEGVQRVCVGVCLQAATATVILHAGVIEGVSVCARV